MINLKKTASVLTAASILVQSLCCPFNTYASVTGPAQPEFSGFNAVNSDSMYNPFTGDLSYNVPVVEIPGPDGGGYALSLSYSSNIGAEAEASWVGYGWTLNPGAIVRNKQGFPDDVNEGKVTYYNKTKTNRTISAGLSGQFGISSTRAFGIVGYSMGATKVLQWNNYKGLSTSSTPYLNYQVGMTNITASFNGAEGDGIYSFSHASPLSFMLGVASATANSEIMGIKEQYNLKPIDKASKYSGQSISSSSYAAYTLHNKSVPTPTVEYNPLLSGSAKLSFGLYMAPSPLPIGFGPSTFGTFNWQSTYDSKEYTYYGYRYSHNAGEKDMMDYHQERPDNLNPHDEILSAPFSSPDMFNVVGEGLSGTMRLYSSKIGEFHPRKVSNVSKMEELGAHVNYGVNVSASIPYCTGAYITSVSSWDDKGANDNYNFSDDNDESYFFRFIGDMGGSVSMSGSDIAVDADMIGNNKDGYVPKLDSDYRDEVNNGETVGRSSHIGYHTNTEMLKKDYSNKYYKSYSHRSDIENLVWRSESTIGNGIGEIAITNKQGNRYVYALPVYAKSEANVSLSVSKDDLGAGNYLAYKNISSSDYYDTKIGQKISGLYASMHLLTEITSPNYIDRTMDGPSSDDFGGWTKFNYEKTYGDKGSNTTWFRWRAPWKGLIYNPGQLSNPDDDMGSSSSGEKEICYLTSIETATHIAVFTMKDRNDGLEAEDEYTAAMGGTMNLTDNKKLKKLEKITLYSKDNDNTNLIDNPVISRTYFEYDYSLALNQPNTIGTGIGSGKLTLKKVWFEYGDVRNAKISPYVFYYEYPTTHNPQLTTDVNYPTKPKYEKEDTNGNGILDTGEDANGNGVLDAGWITTIADEYALLENYADRDRDGNGFADLRENPNYDEANIDAWGNYQANGQERSRDLKTWVDQTPSATTFDPAAWTLKRIKLPTEGEIHIQYEQKEYAYVQDRRASVMVPLLGLQSIITDLPYEPLSGTYGTHYYLDLGEIGANNDADKASIIDWIKKVYIDGVNGRDPEKMYFKFKYDLEGVGTDCPDYQWEYITGYANVMKVGIENEIGDPSHKGELYVQLGNPRVAANTATGDDSDLKLLISLEGALLEAGINDGGIGSPCDACREYFKANKGLKLVGQDCGESAIMGSDDNDAEKFVLQMADLLTGQYSDKSPSACTKVDPAQSYLRIPVPSKKLGGGVRVKRLLRYDNGLEGDDAELYGSEYVYETIDGECSGVAANEPGAIREENSLITYLKKKSELSAGEVLVAGEDKTQFEGPIGETILPGASIGYSRVITKNIHTGATNPGFSTAEFYTAKDYPFDRTTKDGYSGVSYTKIHKHVENPDPQFYILLNRTYYKSWATQGFKFVINNMHGQPRKTTLYDGDYNYINDVNKITELSSTTYNYFEPGELIPVMNSHYNFGTAPLGKEVEVVTESRTVTETNISATQTVDIGLSYLPPPAPPVYYTFGVFSSTSDETYLHTHVTNKIIYCPSVVKSVTNYKDGVYSTLLNKYFDPLSGDPVVQEKSGVFDQQVLDNSVAHQGKYISFNYPASMYYADMGQKAGSEGLTIGKLCDDAIKLTLTSSGIPTVANPASITFSDKYCIDVEGDYCSKLEKLSPGDLIAIKSSSAYTSIAQIKSIVGNVVSVIATSNFYYERGLGTTACNIEVLQSNRANLLAVSAGNIVLYGSFEAPDGLVSAADESYRKSFARYLNQIMSGSTPAKPSALAYISVVNPATNACVQCKEYDHSAVNQAAELQESLENIIDVGKFNIADYQSAVNWGLENTMQRDFLLQYVDGIDRYMGATDNCIICNTDNAFWDATNFQNTMATAYSEWAQDYYSNATSVDSYINNAIASKAIFSTKFVTNSSLSTTRFSLNNTANRLIIK